MGRRRELPDIWSDRAGSFRRETMPYFRYMAQSGFPAFLSLLFIAGAMGYFSLIRDLPPDFPIVLVGVAALTPVICWSPLRTWLANADTVYLMPMEHRMGPYMRRSFRYSVQASLLPAVAVILLYLPIYNYSESGAAPALVVAAALLLKAGNTIGGWRERQMAWSNMRRLYRALRWLLSALALAVWLAYELWQAAGFTVLCGVLVFFMYRLPKRHSLPWERLILEEQLTRKRYYTFFAMFIDVPTLSSKINRRSYLAWLLGTIAYKRNHTYVFLYAAALLRTEIGGILIRILLLGGLIVYWFAEAASLDGWGSAFVYAIVAVVYGLQLGGLRQIHRYNVWRNIYPLPEKGRMDQLLRVDQMAFLAGMLALLPPAALPLLLQGIYIPPLAIVVAVIGYALIRPVRMRKKLLAEADED